MLVNKIRNFKNCRMTTKISQLLLVALFILLYSCGSKDKNQASVIRPVKVVKVTQSYTFKKDFAAVVESNKISILGFRFSGQLVNLPVNEGDWLNKGQLIAQLDPKDKRLQLDADKAAYLSAQSQYERYKVLLERQAISKQEFEVAQTSYERSKAVYENTQNMVADLNLYAPFTGFVLKKSVENYQTVQAGQEVVEFVDPNDLVVKLTLADKNLDNLLSKPTFTISIETIPNISFTAEVRDYVDASPYGLGIPVTLKINDPRYANYRKAIKPGFSANVTMTVHEAKKQGGITIPLTALASEMDTKKMYVWKVNTASSTISKQYVQVTGPTNYDDVTIKSGLNLGDVVVVAGVQQVADGQKVKILPN